MPGSSPLKHLGNLSLLFLSLALVFGAAEFLLRITDLAQRVRSASVAPGEIEQESPSDPDRPTSKWIVHPFRGMTPRPGQETAPESGDPYGTNVFGIRSELEDPRELPGESLVIGIFGGSVARQVGYPRGKKALRLQVEEFLGPDGPKVQVVNFAVSGYKQPQQLQLLIELLLLGVPIDVVVNIDGFNEVALTVDDSSRGHHPLYPSFGFWKSALAASTGAWSERQMELIVSSRQSRRRAAELRSLLRSSGLDRSELAKLVFGLQVFSLENAATEAELELRELPIRKPQEDMFSLGEPCLGQGGDCWELILDIWAGSSRSMQAIAESFGAIYLHFLQPNQYVEGHRELTRDEIVTAWNPDREWSQTAVLGYPLLKRRGRELVDEGISFHDMTDVFAGISESIYADTCCHLTSYGVGILGGAVGDRIARVLQERSIAEDRNRNSSLPAGVPE